MATAKCVGKNAGLLKSKKKVTKPALCTPYKSKWANVKQTTNETIHDILKSILSRVNLRPLIIEQKMMKKEKQEKLQQYRDALSEEQKSLGGQLIKGAGAVTRAVEKDSVRLCVVDRAAPWQLHQHLQQLCALRGCPAVALIDLSSKLTPLLGITSCSVLAFKKVQEGDDKGFTSGIEKIIPLIPQNEALPWVLPESDQSEKDTHTDQSEKDTHTSQSEKEAEIDQSDAASETGQSESSSEIDQSDTLSQNVQESKSKAESIKISDETVKDTKSSATPNKMNFGGDFIGFSKREQIKIFSGIDDIPVSFFTKDTPKKGLKRKKNGGKSTVKRMTYETANVGRMVGRPDKVKLKDVRKMKD